MQMGTVQYKDSYKMKEEVRRVRIRKGNMMMKTDTTVILHFADVGVIKQKKCKQSLEANKNKSLEAK